MSDTDMVWTVSKTPHQDREIKDYVVCGACSSCLTLGGVHAGLSDGETISQRMRTCPVCLCAARDALKLTKGVKDHE